MKVVIAVDENILFGKDAFGSLGEVRFFPGRRITRKELSDVQILLVRSVTKVNAALLSGTSIKFTGTATAGLEHVDQEFLKVNNIQFAHAKGSNAKSVADYVTAGVLSYYQAQKKNISGSTAAVIGCGFVGTQVLKSFQALGLRTIAVDPPLREQTGNAQYKNIGEAVDADIISAHVSLERTGQYPTLSLFNKEIFSRFTRKPLFINASRGETVVEPDLLSALNSGYISDCILDVWNNEPHVNHDLLNRAWIATPHIAGYSFSGKVKGTEMIYKEVCRFLHTAPKWNAEDTYQKQTISADNQDAVNAVVRTAYNIQDDSQRMKALICLPPDKAAERFDELRKNYPRRLDFTDINVSNAPPSVSGILANLGFRIHG